MTGRRAGGKERGAFVSEATEPLRAPGARQPANGPVQAPPSSTPEVRLRPRALRLAVPRDGGDAGDEKRGDEKPAPDPRSDVEPGTFSPAVVALAEHAPGRMTSLLPSLILATLAIGIIWAALSKVDIVVSASGRIIPSARVKLVQPLEPGVIRRIHVEEGDLVREGDPVVELDPTEAVAERDRLRRLTWAARLDVARLRAFLTAMATGGDAVPDLDPPMDVPEEMTAAAARHLASQWARLIGDREAAAREVARLRAQRDGISARIEKETKILPILRERVSTRELLSGKRIMPRSELLELRETLVESEQEVVVLQAALIEAEAEAAEAEAKQRLRVAETRDAAVAELIGREQDAASAAQELVKAEEKARRRTLSAPATGIVTDLAVHTVGGVVTAAQPLMRVVPEDERMEVEALLPNRDVGFVEKGGKATIKVEAFPYLRYGTIPGVVADVAADAVLAPDGRSSAFKLRVSLDRQTIQVAGRPVRLAAGMVVTADIRTGERRVLDFILEPILRSGSEGLRER